jgi:hypothetical protein
MLGRAPRDVVPPKVEGPRVSSRDAMLDTINTLVKRRESTLRQMEAWEATDPSLTLIFDDLRLYLL